MGDFLGDRRRGLEDAFFANQDAILRRRLGEGDAARGRKDALRTASGIADDAVLDRMMGLGISPDTLTALSLIPCVVVAWADEGIDQRERAAMLSAAEQAGLAREGPAYALFEGWLAKRPAPELLAAWKEYVAALLPTLDATAQHAFRSELLGRARAVAAASGGFMGVGRTISAVEQAALDDLERALSPAGS